MKYLTKQQKKAMDKFIAKGSISNKMFSDILKNSVFQLVWKEGETDDSHNKIKHDDGTEQSFNRHGRFNKDKKSFTYDELQSSLDHDSKHSPSLGYYKHKLAVFSNIDKVFLFSIRFDLGDNKKLTDSMLYGNSLNPYHRARVIEHRVNELKKLTKGNTKAEDLLDDIYWHTRAH